MKEIFDALKLWRNDFSQKLGWVAFRICHNSHLISIAKDKPQSMEDLKKVKSFGESRTVNYGEDIISVLNAFQQSFLITQKAIIYFVAFFVLFF